MYAYSNYKSILKIYIELIELDNYKLLSFITDTYYYNDL